MPGRFLGEGIGQGEVTGAPGLEAARRRSVRTRVPVVGARRFRRPLATSRRRFGPARLGSRNLPARERGRRLSRWVRRGRRGGRRGRGRCRGRRCGRRRNGSARVWGARGAVRPREGLRWLRCGAWREPGRTRTAVTAAVLLRRGGGADVLVGGAPRSAGRRRGGTRGARTAGDGGLDLLCGTPLLPGGTGMTVGAGRLLLGGVAGEHLGDADPALRVERAAALALGFLTVAPGLRSPFLRLRGESGSAAVVGHARSLRSGSLTGLCLLVDRREDGFRYRTDIRRS